jgi:hypothetical protein
MKLIKGKWYNLNVVFIGKNNIAQFSGEDEDALIFISQSKNRIEIKKNDAELVGGISTLKIAEK